jgi:predicted ATPase
VPFPRLSVFAGGWTIEAAEFLGAGGVVTASDTLGLMQRLIDQSLVVSEERRGTVREAMLQTLRGYGHDRQVEVGEAELVRRRHLYGPRELAERIEPSEPRPSAVAAREHEWDTPRRAALGV